MLSSKLTETTNMIKLIVSQYNKTLFNFEFDETKFDRIDVVVEYLEFVC